MSKFKDSWGKAKILLSQWLCIGAMFTACTDDEVVNQTTKALQVSVSTEAPAESRAIIDGGYLPDGASIGVTLTAEDGTAYDGQAFTNLQYTAAGEGAAQTWSSATPASLSITAGKVIAYYPYYGGDDFDLKAIPVETASQTDYMYAKPVTGINMVSPAANLTMQHAMTDIRINVKKGTYTGTGEVTKITAKAPAFATSATMDVETGVFANVSGGGAQFVQELSGAAISSANVVHDFLIVPDAKSTSGDVSIFVIIDGKKFAVTVPYTEAFQQGFAYTYNLTLDNAALTLDGVSVSKWGVKAEVDESLQFYDDQYIVEIQVPSDGYRFYHNIVYYNLDIDWGDGTIDSNLSSSSTKPSHVYAKAGKYRIIASGKIYKFNPTDSKIITKLERIGKNLSVGDFYRAFKSQTKLTEIAPGALDGCTKVTDFNYAFQGCKGLTTLPEGMFDKCTEVTSFYETFDECENLTTIPAGLFDKCTKVKNFEHAFQQCTNLTEIPEGLFDKCTEVTNFEGAFLECKSLQAIPEGLFDNNTKVTSFERTFAGCGDLQAIPEGLFDNCTEVEDLTYAFRGCAGLTSIPVGLFDKCTKLTNFEGTFSGCTSMQELPEGLFDKCTEVTSFQGTFDYCTNLTIIPKNLFKYNTKVTDFSYVFHYCTKIKEIPEGLFDNCPEVTSFGKAFMGCRSVTEIPEGLFDYNTKVTSFCKSASFNCYGGTSAGGGAFQSTFIQTIPEGLFDHCTEVVDFNHVFENTNIVSIPKGLFDACSEVTSFEKTFAGCGDLQAIPEGLFDYNTKVTSFSRAFYNCYKLTKIPEGLFDNCTKVTNFRSMFECSTWNKIVCESPYTVINVDGQDVKVHLYERANYPEYFTTPTSYTDCFYYCTSLTDYSSIPSEWK